MTTKVRKLKALLGFQSTSDPDLLKQLNAVYGSMNGNPAFSAPPVDMPSFKTGIDKFTVLVTDAEDGGKRAITAMKKQREEMIRQVTLLGHYVEAVSNGDLASFSTSGFVVATTSRAAPQPLSLASFAWVDRGPAAGGVEVKVKRLPGALSYDVRYGVVAAGGAPPASWTNLTLPGAKKAIIANLTPGANYAFQVRALGRLGYTDWSDSTTFICG
jgi:hypothetical protein